MQACRIRQRFLGHAAPLTYLADALAESLSVAGIWHSDYDPALQTIRPQTMRNMQYDGQPESIPVPQQRGAAWPIAESSFVFARSVAGRG